MVMGEEARMGVADGPFRKASTIGSDAKHAKSPNRSPRQNVIEIGPKFDLKNELSKMKVEPVMLLKVNNLINDKMPDAMMFLNRKDLGAIHGNFIKLY
jgi:hypothetical protein